MKKRWAAIAAAMILGLSVLPVSATEISNENPAGNTEVTASVSHSGDVTYLISVPAKINFGALKQPENNTEAHLVTRNYSVEAIRINGLDLAASRVAVLLKDPEMNGGFQISGVSEANKGKILNYFIYNESGTDITEGTLFTNGYLLAAFDSEGQKVNGELRLDQNQLFGEDLDGWAGSYNGTIRFYSKIVSLDDVK